MAHAVAYDREFRDRLTLARTLGISEKRLLGWEPTETHVHTYDDAGRMVRTVVTREPEWDDWERTKMLALSEHEASLCECGFPRWLADEDPDLEVTMRTCPVCSGLAVAQRQIAAEDDRATEALGSKPAPDVPRPGDGRVMGLREKPKRSDDTSR